MSPASSSFFASLASCSSERAGVVAEQVAHLVEIDLGELARVRRVAQQVLERVDVAELVEHAAHLVERHRLVAAEPHLLAPAHLRERVAQVLAELVDLPAQVHVVEQRVRELLQLRALLGRHRVQHLLHLRHRAGHLLEQLVEASAGSRGRSRRSAP